MHPSHKLTRIFLALASLIALAALSFGQVPILVPFGAPVNAIEVSDQKPGSMLVFPYYTSSTGQIKTDTRLTLTNLVGTIAPIPAPANPALANGSINVHIFFIEGSSCNQADLFVCLTKGASVSFKASDYDPDRTGYVIAVAVDPTGRPTHWNGLVGNAFVNAGDLVGNYGAESFAANGNFFGAQLGLNPDGTVTLPLNGLGFDRAADQFAVEIQSPNDATGQTIVQVSLSGNISTSAMNSVAQNGTGLVWRGDEKLASYVKFIGGGCQSINVISATNPRVPTGLGTTATQVGFLPKGSNGTLVYNTSAPSVGLIMTPKSNAWSGIRTLHKTRTADSNLIIPVFMPAC